MRLAIPLSPLALLILVAGCSGGGRATPPALAYRLPEPTTVTYVSESEVYQEVDAMGQSMAGGGEVNMTIEASFEEVSGGLRATLNVVEADADIGMPGAGSVTADEDDIGGPLVMVIDREGNVAVEALPEIDGSAEEVFGFVSIANTFFPALPGTGVAAGATWTDTASFAGEEGGGEMEATGVKHYTLEGDTIVGGERLLKVTWTGTLGMSVLAQQEGVSLEIAAELDDSGHFLWDPVAHLLVEVVGVSEGVGTVNVPMLPEAIPLAMSQRTTMTLRR